MSCNRTVHGCRPVGDQSAISRRSVGERSADDRSATGWRLYLECLFLIAESVQLFGDRSATDLRSLWSQRGFTCSNQNLLATKSSLQPSATGRRPLQPPCNLPATTRNFGRKEVADRLQGMCDRGLRGAKPLDRGHKWRINSLVVSGTSNRMLLPAFNVVDFTACAFVLNMLNSC